ncbi:methylmalonyl-CoA mutase subunit beta [Salinimicrobium tongyeongense]|uniref:Methylmalonyl-CoA mutase subunit beta n=1 Tax=Salinimicrobium tongyeongense TaxID=2809707 RepID=A0ABY6NRT8_9FLAO|nr:methylmalonyl-CoA mutase subunit beta [Salinimicrobium tongyeongense]UZH55622.1 methylmalonyl-CoA mutase subunit beta [Salinimicrobium tongyeongense]
MRENLFSEFEEVSAKQWKQKIQYDLKGADYNEALVWKSLDGINVKPFYHAEESPEPIQPGSPLKWNVTQQIYVSSAEKANKKAHESLRKGAESIWFILPSEEIELKQLFEGLNPEVPIYLKPEVASEEFFLKLDEQVRPGSKVFLQFDIIGNLARSGNWYKNQQEDYQLLDTLLQKCHNLESFISVDTGLYQNAGATIPQQLAYAMAHLNEYLNHINERAGESKRAKFQFLVSVGPNYFFEIAKIRALRLLFSTLSSEYGLDTGCDILSQPTRRNKTLYDYNVNLLRTTTECMSAVLGGSNSVCNMAYDAIYHKNNHFGSRIARNQLLILKHESYFEKVANPAEGSYYIETLTHEMADKALDIFKNIEKGGGFVTQLKEGIIQKKISESAANEQQAFDEGKLVLVGTNKYPNAQDRMKDELELYPFVKQKPRKTLLQPVIEKRLSEKTEQERLQQEASTNGEK